MLLHKRKLCPSIGTPTGERQPRTPRHLLETLLSLSIWYPSGIFIVYKASVSAPCLARVTKGSMKAQRLDAGLLRLAILVGQILLSL
jgi:hypothetical protein